MRFYVCFFHFLAYRKNSVPFQFRWTILCIFFFLCLSDFLYFCALSLLNSKISMVSVARCSGTIVSFLTESFFS